MSWSGQVFAADMEAFAMMAKARMLAVARQSIQEVALRVVFRTPVGVTGFLRASWNGAPGSPPPMPMDQGRPGVRVSYEDSGVEIPVNMVMANITLALAKLKPGEPFYLVNNARYALRIENGFVGVDRLGRQINQRGRFIVRDAVSQWRSIVGEQAALLGGSGGGAGR